MSPFIHNFHTCPRACRRPITLAQHYPRPRHPSRPRHPPRSCGVQPRHAPTPLTGPPARAGGGGRWLPSRPDLDACVHYVRRPVQYCRQHVRWSACSAECVADAHVRHALRAMSLRSGAPRWLARRAPTTPPGMVASTRVDARIPAYPNEKETVMSENWHFETRQIHVGHTPDADTRSRAVPIYQTASYVFNDTEHAAKRFSLAELGPIYTRLTNPTNGVAEDRIASLEGGVGGLVVASGQAAELVAILNVAEAGDHLEIGRASCRERGAVSVGGGAVKRQGRTRMGRSKTARR